MIFVFVRDFIVLKDWVRWLVRPRCGRNLFVGLYF